MASLADRFLVQWRGIPMAFGLLTSTTFHMLNNRGFRTRFNENAFGTKEIKIAKQFLPQWRRKEVILHFEMASYAAPVALGTFVAGAILYSLPKMFRFPNSVGFAVCGLGLSIGSFVAGALLLDGPMYAYTEWVQQKIDKETEKTL